MKVVITIATALLLCTAFSSFALAYDCVYGNSDYNATHWSSTLPDGLDSYAYLIRPSEEGCGNGVGFSVTEIRIWLAVQSGGSFGIEGSILEAVDSGNGCYTPGAVLDTSESSNVTGWPEVGGINVGVLCDFGCLPADRAYFLSIKFTACDATVVFPRNPDLSSCTSYMDQGAGFTDLQDFEGGGGLVIYGRTDNCDEPLPAEESTWGGIKALYYQPNR